MLSAQYKNKHIGLSLIEVMIGILIMGILAAVAIPSFNTWMQNTRVRNAAESVVNGLQHARSEAVARNTNVAFALSGGSAWTVSIVAPASAIASRSSGEDSSMVTVTTTPLGTTTLTFNNFGTVGVPPNQPNNSDGSAPFTLVDFVAIGGTKKYRVEMGGGGNARMCDCGIAANSSPRACLNPC